MKQIFILLMVAMCATMFTACSDDDENNNVRGANGERLVSKITYDESEYKAVDIYNYDKQGRVISIESIVDGEENVISRYTYEKYKITVKTTNSNPQTRTYTLNDKGVIISEADDEKTNSYTYDGDKLIATSYGAQFTWENGNIVKGGYNGYEGRIFTYNLHENKRMDGYFLTDELHDHMLFNYGYFGSKSKNLVASEMRNGNISTYEYEFDKEGYITVMRVYETENGAKNLKATVTYEYK